MSTRIMPAHAVPVAAPPATGWRSWRSYVLPIGVAAAAALWGESLRSVRLDRMGGWGLLTALPPTWYAALALVVLLYVWALLGRRPVDHVLAACPVVLVALLFGTTSVVYDVPRYSWTYKHVGMVEQLLQQHWAVHRSIDIYQNFPGFLYVAAFTHTVTGVPVLELARWAQPFFALLTAAAVYWVVGGLSSSRRVRYGAVLLYTLGDWIGQNYFAPQAFAFPVALFVLGGLLRSVPPGSEGIRWARLAARFPLPEDADLPRANRFWRSRWGTATLILGYAVVTVSHPLSPLILLAQATIVCVLLRPVRPWLPVVFVAIEEAWLLQAWPFLNSTYDLFEFGLRNIDPPQTAVGHPLAGYSLALWAAPLVMVVLALLAAWAAAIAVFRRRRAARMLVPMGLAGVPLVMVLGQPYGNEGIFRAYLFALPFLAFVVALHLFDELPRWTRGRRTLTTLVVVLIAGLTLPANFASELSYRVLASDVAADRWFEQHAPPGAVLLPFDSSYPVRGTAAYAQFLPKPSGAVDGLSELPGFAQSAADEGDLVSFTRDACDTRTGTGPVYLALGPTVEEDVRLLGTLELYTYRAYERELATAPGFQRVFSDGGTVLYRCRD